LTLNQTILLDRPSMPVDTDFWEENTRLCLERYPDVVIRKDMSTDVRSRVITSQEGSPTLEYVTAENKKRFFHSWYHPRKEAGRWVENMSLHRESILVILGGGLFYHVAALLEKVPGSWPVIIVERDEEIFEHAMRSMDLAPVLSRKKVTLCVGGKAQDVIETIKAIRKEERLHPVLFFKHPPSVQTFFDYYDMIIRAFQRPQEVKNNDQLKYRKFQGDRISVLLLATEYFLMGPVATALTELKIDYRLITFNEKELDRNAFLNRIKKNIREVKPDFIFTINHLGFDREGALLALLDEIEMPCASWFVDSPHLIIPHYRRATTQHCGLFVWDHCAVGEMRTRGMDHVFHVPLGADVQRFRPIPDHENPRAKIDSAVGFVGNSMVKKCAARLAGMDIPDVLHCSLQALGEHFSRHSTREPEEVVKRWDPGVRAAYESLPGKEKADVNTLIMWEATRVYRMACVNKLLHFKPLIAGDKGWLELFDRGAFHYHPEVSYYSELPLLYNALPVNFNATSRQMKGAVNQRVFDVPACRSFLITDYEEQIEELFEVGKEVICYRHIDEIQDLVDYYLKHENERNRIAQKGYERVMRDHAYGSRMKFIIETMRSLYKESAA